MARTNRVQFGLIFDDSDMFDKFIEPYKKSRELQPLVLKLLSLYYYDNEVRGMVDSLSAPENANSSTNVVEEALGSIKENFVLLETSIKSANGSLDEGVANLVKMCDAGIAKTSEEDKHFEKFGSLNSPLILKDVRRQQEQEALETEKLKQEEEAKNKLSDHEYLESLGSQVSKLNDTVTMLCQSLMQSGSMAVNQASIGVSPATAVHTAPVNNNNNNTAGSSELNSSTIEEDTNVNDTEQHVAEDDLDGADAINNLLKGW